VHTASDLFVLILDRCALTKPKTWDLVTHLEINVTVPKQQTALNESVLSVSRRLQLRVIAVPLTTYITTGGIQSILKTC
jgi:hypothetical protein